MTSQWDLTRFEAAIRTPETYVAVLSSNELPTALVACLDQLNNGNATLMAKPQLQQCLQILLQMIDFPAQPAAMDLIGAAKDWAIETLLALQAPTLELLMNNKPLQQLQKTLFASSAHTRDNLRVHVQNALLKIFTSQQNALSSPLHLKPSAMTNVLELCASTLTKDADFVQFVETILASDDCVTLSDSVLHRVFHDTTTETESQHADERENAYTPSTDSCPFHQFTLETKVRIWANHLPTWQAQLEQWMLTAHTRPFDPIEPMFFASGDHSTKRWFQSYSYLYVAMIQWFHVHANILASCRSMELLSLLSERIRSPGDQHAFDRKLLDSAWLQFENSDYWSALQRRQVFAANIREKVDKVNSFSSEMKTYEWIGVMERPNIIQEAFEMLVTSSSNDEVAVQGASALLGWFYSFSTTESFETIIKMLSSMAAALCKKDDVHNGVRWLQQHRLDFALLPLLRIKLSWFWLLQQSLAESPHRLGQKMIVDALESIEYVFRRFTPVESKAAFQIELVTQLLFDLEWRWKQHVSCDRMASVVIEDNIDAAQPPMEGNIAVLCNWLNKIVHLLQLEQQMATKAPLTYVEQFTQRMHHIFFCSNPQSKR